MNSADARVRGQEGYTLVGLLILVAIVNIGLAVAVTSWRAVDTRAREAELIWRGEQIVRAISCHGTTEATAPLEKLEQLVESNCLRNLYRDPMSRDGKWRILRQSDLTDGTIAALLGEPAPDAEDGSGAAGQIASFGAVQTPATIVLGPGQTPGTPATSASGLQASVAVERPSLQVGLSLGASTGGVGNANTIIGVMSQKTGAATRVYRTYEKYENWLFLGVQEPS